MDNKTPFIGTETSLSFVNSNNQTKNSKLTLLQTPSSCTLFPFIENNESDKNDKNNESDKSDINDTSNKSEKKRNPTVAVIVQCRLSSVRLPLKALLPLGEHCVLWYALSAMKKVKADYYYLATDEVSAPALAPIADECGYLIHKGSLTNVLDRFITLIKKLDADVILRATADNPFLFTDAAQDSLNLFIRANYPESDIAKDFFKVTNSPDDLLLNFQKAIEISKGPLQASSTFQTSCDYLTLTALPHGSGIEVFGSAALLSAAPIADGYDREHVGPALYRHTDRYKCVFVPAPKKYSFPKVRSTIDTPRDYHKAFRVQRALSKLSAPYSTTSIISAFEKDEEKVILFVPTTKKRHGTGHLRRACRLACALRGYILINPRSTLPNIDAIIKGEGVEPWQVLHISVKNLKENEFDLIVSDLCKASRRVMRALKAIAPVVAVDEGGDYRTPDYTIDALGSIKSRQVNISSLNFATNITREDEKK